MRVRISSLHATMIVIFCQLCCLYRQNLTIMPHLSIRIKRYESYRVFTKRVEQTLFNIGSTCFCAYLDINIFQGPVANDGDLPVRHPAGQRGHPRAPAVHVLPHVLRVRQPRLRAADPAQDPQLETEVQVLPLVSMNER